MESHQNATHPSLADMQSVPELVEVSTGWTIQLSDSEGKNVLNLPIFAHKFLAEEALARLIQEQQDSSNSTYRAWAK